MHWMALGFVIPFLVLWLLFCSLLALLGWVLPAKILKLNSDEVEASLTVCKILNEKGLISDDEYGFETQKVARLYDQLTFKGYLFIMNPVIAIMKGAQFLDAFVLWLVKRWMNVHRHFLGGNQNPPAFHVMLTRLCTHLAFYLGKTLKLFGSLSRFSLEL